MVVRTDRKHVRGEGWDAAVYAPVHAPTRWHYYLVLETQEHNNARSSIVHMCTLSCARAHTHTHMHTCAHTHTAQQLCGCVPAELLAERNTHMCLHTHTHTRIVAYVFDAAARWGRADGAAC